MNDAVLISDWTKESQDLYHLSCPQRLIDDLMDSDLTKYIPSLKRAHLTDEQKAEIGDLWAEGMECGALCFYYWMYDNPHIKSDAARIHVDEILQRYTYENFEWAVFHIGPYYVLEAYFSH